MTQIRFFLISVLVLFLFSSVSVLGDGNRDASLPGLEQTFFDGQIVFLDQMSKVSIQDVVLSSMEQEHWVLRDGRKVPFNKVHHVVNQDSVLFDPHVNPVVIYLTNGDRLTGTLDPEAPVPDSAPNGGIAIRCRDLHTPEGHIFVAMEYMG